MSDRESVLDTWCNPREAVCKWNNRKSGISIYLSAVFIIYHNPILGKVQGYWMWDVISTHTHAHTQSLGPWLQGHKYTVSCILSSTEHCFSIFLWLKTKGCQCSINELWRDLSVTSRRVQCASGRKIGRVKVSMWKAPMQLQLDLSTSRPVKYFAPMNLEAL